MSTTKKHAEQLLAKSLTLMVNSLTRERYTKASSKVGKILLEQKTFVDKVMTKTGLQLEELQDLIQRSVTIFTFATLLGWDFGSRLGRKEGIKAAAIGATIGLVIALGDVLIRIVLVKGDRNVDVENFEVIRPNEVREEDVVFA